MAGGAGQPLKTVASDTRGGGQPTPVDPLPTYYPADRNAYIDYSPYALPSKSTTPSTPTTGTVDYAPNAYGAFSQNPDYSNPYGQSTLADYFASLPSYQQPGGSQGNTAFAADLAARSQAQAAAQENTLKAAEATRVQQSADALKAYQVQLANQEWQRRLDAVNAELNQFKNPEAGKYWTGSSWESVPSGGDSNASYGWYSGATGGLASLQGFDK